MGSKSPKRVRIWQPGFEYERLMVPADAVITPAVAARVLRGALAPILGGGPICASFDEASLDPKGAIWREVMRRAHQIEWNGFRKSFIFTLTGERYVLGWDYLDQMEDTRDIIGALFDDAFWPEQSNEGRDICRLAVLLTLAWRTPELVDQFTVGWHRLVGGGDEVGEVANLDRRPGHLRVDLGDYSLNEIGGPEMFSCSMVIQAKRGPKMLKPRTFRADEEKFLERVADAPKGDLAFLRALETFDLFTRATEQAYRITQRQVRATKSMLRRVFTTLDAVSEVTFRGRAVKVQTARWRPRFMVRDLKGGGLSLSWQDEPEFMWSLADMGWVIDEAWRLWACTPKQTHLLRRVSREHRVGDDRYTFLPNIEPDQVEAFLAEGLPALPVEVDFQTKKMKVRPGKLAPVLRLHEAAGAMAIEPVMAYEGQLSALAAGPLVQTEKGWVSRDVDGEAALRVELDAALGRSAPCTLDGDDVYDFLLSELPSLKGWRIEAEQSLLKRATRVTQRVSMKSGVDWFDLDVSFSADGESVSLRKVLDAMKRKRRYVQLKGDRVARLPERWLATHGDSIEELENLRRASKKRLKAYATPVVAGLLGEVDAEGVKEAEEMAARWRETAAKIQRFEGVSERRLPRGLKATLRDYQRSGYLWISALRDLGLGAVLADDMGLGKTVQALTYLLSRRRIDKEPALVVAPTSVVFNWMEECARFTPDLRTHLHHGPLRGEPPKRGVDVVVTSYAILRRDAEMLQARRWGTVVLDEAQHIKNPLADVSQAARGLNAGGRLVLTGTPLENHLIELWSMFEFLMPGFFGSQASFRQRYADPVHKHNSVEALSALRQRIRPFVLRRLKREVATELPPRQVQVLRCQLGPEQRKIYEGIREAYRASVMEKVEDAGVRGATIQVLEALTRMRQACCHPGLLPGGAPDAPSAKLDLLLDTLLAATEEGHRSLVFSQWPSFLKLVRAELDRQGITYLYLDGSTRKRATLQAEWNDPEGPPVFLISIKAGGSGLNLTGADHVFHLDPWWNPAVENQATDRAHRIGQTKPVLVYKLIAADTAEEKILEIQARKQALFDATLDTERMEVQSLTRDDLEAVFSHRGPVPLPAQAPEAGKAPPREVPAPGPAGDDEMLHRLMAEGAVTTGKLREALGGCSAYKANALLKKFVGAGLLVKVGATRNTRYVTP